MLNATVDILNKQKKLIIGTSGLDVFRNFKENMKVVEVRIPIIYVNISYFLSFPKIMLSQNILGFLLHTSRSLS
jgi:hypothetical protein